MKTWLKTIPNILTGSRLFFAGGFLVLLCMADYDHDLQTGMARGVHQLTWSFILFIIAGITDILDGPLARGMGVTSSFGRIFDPLVDKILIAGGFIVMAIIGKALTGIAWWMVALILAREVLVTVVRHLSEAQGKEFGATWAGKLKMFLQSFTLGTIVMFIAYHQKKDWSTPFRDISIWITVIYTAISALIYLPRMKKIFKSTKDQ